MRGPVVCTVDLGKRDTEVKILLGCSRAQQRRILSLHNWGVRRSERDLAWTTAPEKK